MREQQVFLLKGEIGSGKTALMKTLGKLLNLMDEVSSPTYSIVNEYILPSNEKLYHFDLYRIQEMEELLEMGFEEYLYSDSYCFIEWPEIAKELLPAKYVQISIQVLNSVRLIELVSAQK